jgi:hypothetical protein
MFLLTMKKKKLGTPNPAKISFGNGGRIKTYSKARKIQQLVNSRPTQRKWLQWGCGIAL